MDENLTPPCLLANCENLARHNWVSLYKIANFDHFLKKIIEVPLYKITNCDHFLKKIIGISLYKITNFDHFLKKIIGDPLYKISNFDHFFKKIIRDPLYKILVLKTQKAEMWTPKLRLIIIITRLIFHKKLHLFSRIQAQIYW